MTEFAVKGFDVSNQNRGKAGQRIDWSVVGEAGEVDFCGIRLMDGLLYESDADYNRKGAESIAMPHLGYQAAYPWRDPVQQAREFAAAVKDGPYRAAGDLERNGGLSPADYLKWAWAYVNEFEQAAGRQMVIYTGPWFGSTFLQGAFASRPLWIANPYNAKPSLPKGWSTWVIWQYSWIKSFKGIYDTTVDGDYFNGSLDDMRAFFGVTGPAPLSLAQRVERLEAAAVEHGWSL